MNLEQLCHQVCELAKETGIFIKAEASKFTSDKVEVKGANNFVSYVDKQSEQKIVAGLKKLLPNSGFIAEEGTGGNIETRYQWVIDPLDGTTNFIHGLPPYAISIALMDNSEVIIGVVYEICANECFYAWKDSKAYLNGNPINVTSASTVNDALIATGFPYYDYSLMPAFFNSLEYFFTHSHGVRRIGSAATDLAYVACGRFEAFYEYGLHAWDVAAGSLILQQAGGKVSDFNGNNNYIFGKEIVASNKNFFPEFQQTLNKIFVK
jgi:myo-inositol-1(or 4)-monophosphatase